MAKSRRVATTLVEMTCVGCNLRIVGELRRDGMVYPARNPVGERVKIAGECMDCIDKARERNKAKR